MRWRHKWARLRQTSWAELHARARQEAAKRWDCFVYPVLPHHESRGARSTATQAQFFFSTAKIPGIIATISQSLPEARARVVHSAEKICRRRFDLLGYLDLNFGDPINWHLDAVSGKCAPRKPFYRIRFLDFEQAGDVKVTWELNRHQHLVTLARAYCFTGDRKFVDELVDQWYSWLRDNPYPIGINWTSSLEAAFRCLSWLWIRHLLAGRASVPAQFWTDLDSGLLLGGRHIERYLSTYFSPNTHLLGEGVALFFLGLLCPHGKGAERWKARGWEIVLRESERQVLPDGMHFEQSTYYHVYALDLFLHARILAERNGITIPSSFDATLQRMLEASATISVSEVAPRLGDDDGGRLFNPRRNLPENLLDPLSTGCVLYRRADLKPARNGLAEETVWLLGPEAAAEFDSLNTIRPEVRTAALRSSGTYIMAQSGASPYVLVMDAGLQGPRGAVHGHADALSVQLSVSGEALLTDAGTYVYVDAGSERQWFRGTSAHNTLTVDGKDQSDGNGPFRWQVLPEVRLETWIEGDAFNLLAASHTGYQRLPEPVLHRRRVFQLKDDFWFILDIVDGSGTHDLDLHWHLAPGVEWQRQQNAVIAKGPKGCVALVTTEELLARQSVEPSRYSPVYGQRLGTQVLRFHCRCAVPAEFATVLLAGVANGQDTGTLLSTEAEDTLPPVSAYIYRRRSGDHLLVFPSRHSEWRWRDLTSDAEFLHYRVAQDGGESLIMVGASYVAIEGKRLINSSRRVQRLEVSGPPGNDVSCSDSSALKNISLEKLRVLEHLSKGLGQSS